MRILDRLVSDFVRQSTGYNARGLVRAVGGKNILLLGAAVAGGALLKEALERKAQGEPVPRGTAKPAGAAPTARAAASLPLPPLPTIAAPTKAAPATVPPSAGDTGAELPPHLLHAIVRTMIAAALADGELAAEERRVIEQHVAEAGFDEPQLQQIRRDMVLPASTTELVRLVTGDDRELMLRFATLVARSHGSVSDHESSWLAGLRLALGISTDRARQIEEELFGGGSA